MVKNDISEINDIKTNTITLIVFNIILYTLIAIVLFLFGIVYVSADTITNETYDDWYEIFRYNSNWNSIGSGYAQKTSTFSGTNTSIIDSVPKINGNNIPIEKSSYSLEFIFTMGTLGNTYKQPRFYFLVQGNNGWITATCDGVESYITLETWPQYQLMPNIYGIGAKHKYTCSKLDVSQNFNGIMYRTSDTSVYYNLIQWNSVIIQDLNDISADTEIIINNNNNNTERIIESNNSNTDRIIEKQTEIYNQVHGLDTLFKDDNISNHTGVFGNITFNSTGAVSGIVSAPLSAIQGIISSTCSPLVLPLPYVNSNLTLPCMSSIYTQYFGTFFSMYQAIVLGITAYWVCINIFRIVKKLGDPEDDRIEVLDL